MRPETRSKGGVGRDERYLPLAAQEGQGAAKRRRRQDAGYRCGRGGDVCHLCAYGTRGRVRARRHGAHSRVYEHDARENANETLIAGTHAGRGFAWATGAGTAQPSADQASRASTGDARCGESLTGTASSGRPWRCGISIRLAQHGPSRRDVIVRRPSVADGGELQKAQRV